MIYLFTYLASLMDYPETKATAKVLAEKFAWKLLGGPNKEVSRGLMEWLLTRWDRIAHGFKSEHALAWEKRRDGEKTGERSHSSQTHVSEPAPQYEKKERRGSGDRSPTSAERPAPRPPLSTVPTAHPLLLHPLPPPSAPCLTVPAVAPRLHDFNPGKPLCGPQPSPASVELANPWEAEDTPVITPFRAEDGVYEAAMEDRHHDVGVEDVWDEFQRAEFEAIESMLQPSADKAKQPPPSVCSEADDMSVYSQDDDLLDEIINDYSDDSQTHLPQSQEQGNHEVAECLIPSIPKHTRHIAVAPDEDDPAMLKQQFEAALLERELVQKKLETLSKKFQGIQLR
ncbi:hypothetical protein EUX98_g5573 [Antrodiella citrinella]|uniref:Uncharacterized protein n=1 Tax=Antrodiella citrinella TaxID=2447956 RepID=A0A4S4MT22_9APHY|nr:hypothetical protein EUX98_g5573 [Antrodiella citrinella]